jgi:hypothetical protein
MINIEPDWQKKSIALIMLIVEKDAFVVISTD